MLFVLCLAVAAAVVACSSKNPSVSPTSPSGSVPAPALDSPSTGQQLDTLRPTLTVRNASGGGSGIRTYDFQLALNSTFTPVVLSKLSVVENASGKTSVTIDTDLQPSTLYYWRVRLVQGGAASDWVVGNFHTKAGSYNRPGELYDLLTDGYTIGERTGATTFIPGEGLRIDNANSYVRYQLPETVSAGEFSMEVKGLAPNGPEGKQKIFSMAAGLGNLTDNPYELHVQYRGRSGNPDNCITFKAVFAGTKLEPSYGERAAGVVSLNPSTTYLWQGSWTSNSFRLVVQEVGGRTIYDRTISGASSPYAPAPHVAYIGANSGANGTDVGSYAGMVVKNVWLSSKPRPAFAR